MFFWNKFTLIGIGLIIIGFFLSVFVVGIPIMIIGFLIGNIGIWYGIYKTIIRFIPNGSEKVYKFRKMVINSYKPYFRKMKK
jgi:hypothetical protein